MVSPMAPENKIRKLWKDHAAKYDVLIGLNDEETAFYLRTSGALQNIQRKASEKILDKTIRLTTEKIMENLRLNLLHPMQRPEEMYIYSGFSQSWKAIK